MMKRPDPTEDLETLYTTLLPVLAAASVGDFKTTIALPDGGSSEVNELLMGVQVLLDVIADKISELEQANARLEDAHNRSVTILEEVLDMGLAEAKAVSADRGSDRHR